jgi:ribosomal protein L37E
MRTMVRTKRCLNCGHPVNNGGYCPACQYPRDTKQAELWQWLRRHEPAKAPSGERRRLRFVLYFTGIAALILLLTLSVFLIWGSAAMLWLSNRLT